MEMPVFISVGNKFLWNSHAMDCAHSASSQGGKRMSGVAPQPVLAESQKVAE